MELKDYYKILELEPPATATQIKQAYRRLAQQYHPDKNTGHEYAKVYFAEIKEAYEVLTNPVKKDQYLQQRWYLQSLGIKKFSDQPVTPPVVLKQLLDLNKYIHSLDTFRMDQEKIFAQLSGILSDNTIDSLKNFNEKDINYQVTSIAMQIASQLSSNHIRNIATRLKSLNKGHDKTMSYIDLLLSRHEKRTVKEKYKPVFIILITVIICTVIYFASR